MTEEEDVLYIWGSPSRDEGFDDLSLWAYPTKIDIEGLSITAFAYPRLAGSRRIAGSFLSRNGSQDSIGRDVPPDYWARTTASKHANELEELLQAAVSAYKPYHDAVSSSTDKQLLPPGFWLSRAN